MTNPTYNYNTGQDLQNVYEWLDKIIPEKENETIVATIKIASQTILHITLSSEYQNDLLFENSAFYDESIDINSTKTRVYPKIVCYNVHEKVYELAEKIAKFLSDKEIYKAAYIDKSLVNNEFPLVLITS